MGVMMWGMRFECIARGFNRCVIMENIGIFLCNIEVFGDMFRDTLDGVAQWFIAWDNDIGNMLHILGVMFRGSSFARWFGLYAGGWGVWL